MDSNEPHCFATMMLCRLCAINQGTKESGVHHHKWFLNLIKALETQWGPLFPSKLGNSCFESNEQCRKLFFARLFLSIADKGRFDTLVEKLHKQYLAKADNYPKLVGRHAGFRLFQQRLTNPRNLWITAAHWLFHAGIPHTR